MRIDGSRASSSLGFEPEAPPVAERRRVPVVNLVLFAATLVTTTIAGALNANVPANRLLVEWRAGLPFSLSLMGILLAHEMGHYLMAKRHRVPATLPFFLPGPPLLIGTFGAFIRMKASPRDRRALFDIGAAGPWAGFVVALPITIAGLAWSRVEPIPPELGGFYFGDSLLFKALSALIVGRIPYGFDVVLHPVAMAGWFGLFVTALNLLPVGQLDGGHVIYSMFGRRHRVIARTFLVTILALGFLGWAGWFVWAVLVTFAGIDHPPTLDRATQLDPTRATAAWATLALFVLTLVPVPITALEGGVGPTRGELVPVSYPTAPRANP
ncbi:MAG: hypothetical protein QOD06_2344 [Candidatus Binatota bacterium]|nr:hypothetical protein [Candidatus Binatota bacterium]